VLRETKRQAGCFEAVEELAAGGASLPDRQGPANYTLLISKVRIKIGLVNSSAADAWLLECGL